MYKMLDLFCGLKGASQCMLEDEDWTVTTVDIEEKFNPDICTDVLKLKPSDLNEHYDLIWASPPCTHFSIARVYDKWDKNGGIYMPKIKKVSDDVKLVYHTLYLINNLNKDYWILENPRGMLRKIIGPPRGTITYCQYGATNQKPTDLWGEIPESFPFRKCSPGDECHEPAHRGQFSGTQNPSDDNLWTKGTKSSIRAKVPEGVSKAVKESVENPEIPTIEDFAKVKA